MALPRKGLSGVEKIDETTAWTNSMAESGAARVKGQKLYAHTGAYVQIYNPELTEMDPEQV